MLLNMSKQADYQTDLAAIRQMIGGPDAGLAQIMRDQSSLPTPAEARGFLEEICAGLESAMAGPVLTTDQVRVELDQRRRARRSAA